MRANAPLFTDRHDAGRRLAAALTALATERPLILALPRGGVPVAAEVADCLGAELDVLIVRKLGAPGIPELGLGALVDGRDPQVVLNRHVMEEVRPSPEYLEAETERQLREVERRRAAYEGGRPAPDAAGRTVILIDDGLATGGTARAALQALRGRGARRLILAVPVAPRQSLDELRPDADQIVCLATPDPFVALSLHYGDFSQTSDEEVIELLARRAGAEPDLPNRAGPSDTSAQA